jgi:hypothetical protein
VLDPKWYGRRKLIVTVLVVCVAVALGAVAYASNTVPDHPGPGVSNPCDLPLSQRTGGWVCPSP